MAPVNVLMSVTVQPACRNRSAATLAGVSLVLFNTISGSLPEPAVEAVPAAAPAEEVLLALTVGRGVAGAEEEPAEEEPAEDFDVPARFRVTEAAACWPAGWFRASTATAA